MQQINNSDSKTYDETKYDWLGALKKLYDQSSLRYNEYIEKGIEIEISDKLAKDAKLEAKHLKQLLLQAAINIDDDPKYRQHKQTHVRFYVESKTYGVYNRVCINRDYCVHVLGDELWQLLCWINLFNQSLDYDMPC